MYINPFVVVADYIGLVQDLTMDDAIGLLPLAMFFQLHHFKRNCEETIMKFISPQNVCSTYNQIHRISSVLSQKLCRIMEHETQAILANGALMQMDDRALREILDGNVLRLTCESDLFEPMLDWADRQCVARKLAINSVNRREILSDRRGLIRFGAMSLDAFKWCLAKGGPDLFTANEVSSIALSIYLPTQDVVARKSTIKRPPRTYRVPIARTKHHSCSNAYYETYERLFLQNPSDRLSLVGFETDASYVVIRIMNLAKTVKYGFVQSGGGRVEFTDPLGFTADGECFFWIKLKQKQPIHTLAKSDKTKRVFANAGSNTFLDAILYR